MEIIFSKPILRQLKDAMNPNSGIQKKAGGHILSGLFMDMRPTIRDYKVTLKAWLSVDELPSLFAIENGKDNRQVDCLNMLHSIFDGSAVTSFADTGGTGKRKYTCCVDGIAIAITAKIPFFSSHKCEKVIWTFLLKHESNQSAIVCEKLSNKIIDRFLSIRGEIASLESPRIAYLQSMSD